MQQQNFNEALISLCILLYQIDGRISYSEQEYLSAVEQHFDWQSVESIEDFHARTIHKVRAVIAEQRVAQFLRELKEPLSHNAKKAMAVAQGLAFVDGELADEERDILSQLENRLLAKALRGQI
jgi:tellurite resistance protein